jgi:hypothetical protein
MDEIGANKLTKEESEKYSLEGLSLNDAIRKLTA